MPESLVCPDVQQFERLRRGELSLAEVEQLAQHVEQCRLCAERVQTAEMNDTLLQTFCTLPTAIEPADRERVAELMERLKGLPLAYPVPNVPEIDIVLGPAQAADEIGRLGEYRILKVLGAGGMGMVYQAEDVRLKRPVALKVMKAAVAKNPGSRERFLREARAAAQLKSDHVVTIYQVGEDRQIVFLAMEYLEGMSLAEWLDKSRKPTLAQAARMGRQIALGLAAAHERGLIHRDIKPGNIWLESNQQGRVKLLDFGLARGTADEIQLTQSGALIGTPAFMAPEQARGVKVDHRCDLFSLGVVLYRLTTGQMPFRGDNTMSLLTALALETPKPPREINPAISPRMAALIERLLSKDREQRPQTAKAVAEELAAIEREASQPAEEDTVKIRAATVRERPVPTAPSRSRLRWLVAASLLLLLGGAAAAIVVIIRDKQGNPIAKIDVPEGGSIEIKNVDQPKNDAKKPPVVQQKAPIAAAPLPSLLPGAPLAPTALVQQPAKLPGVRSWSIEKRDSGMTTAVAYRPDGKRLAVGDWDGRVRIWEPQSGRLVQMDFETRPVGFLAWSPDGKMLAVGVSENAGQSAIQLWDAQAGRSLWRVKTPPGGALGALAWSADGRTLLATVTNVGCLTWNSADGRLLRTVAILCGLAAFSPDAKRLAGGTGENRVALWDVETGKEIRKLEEHKSAALFSLAWSPDGKSLALTAADGVYIWQAETGQRIGHYKDLSPCCFVCWSPDGRTFAATLGSGHGVAVVVVEVGTEGQPRRLEDDGLASLAWSPDGKTIARIAWGGGGYGGWVRLYDAATGKRQRSLTEGCEILSVAALSSDGQTIAVAKGSGITLSSTDTGQVIQRHEDTSGVFALSPDGKRLAAGGPDHVVILWEDGGKVRVPLLGHQQDATWLAWSPDGKRLASASAAEKRLLLWDADKGERLHELGPFPAAAQSPTWTPDGRFVAFFVSHIGWHFWDVERNQLANDPKQWKLDRLCLAPDGRSALVANMGEFYRLRDRTTGKEGRRLPRTAYGNMATPAWSTDGRLLAVPSEAGVELWRGDLARRLRILPATVGYLQQVAFSADGKLVAGLTGECLHLWEADTGRLRGILLRGEKNNGLTIAANGHYSGNEQVERGIVVVVQKDDGTQEVLEPVDFEKKYGWKNEPDKVHLLLPPPPYPLPGQPMGPNALVRTPAELPDAYSWTIETVNARGQVKAVAYRPDGKLLATGGEDGVIRIWDTSNGELVRMLIGGDPVWSLSWSKDGILAAAYPFSGVSLWQTNTGRLLRRLEGGGIVAWSPDGRTLARLGGIGSLTLWDVKTEKDIRSYQFPSEGQALVWSPDGKTLAVGLPDKSARLWDVASGKETHKLEGQDGKCVRSIAWSPDGKRIATMGHADSSAFHVWDAATGKLQGRFAAGGPINFSVLAWSPDGKAVAVGPYGLFDAETGQRIRPFDSSRDAWAVAWAPDGSNQLAIAGNSGIHLLDAGSGKRTHALEERSSDQWIKSFWSPDGRRLALSFQYQGSVSLPIVEAATGRRSYLVQDGSYWVSWSPDSKLLASNISGHAVGLWDAATTRPVRTLEGGGNMLARIMAWSPDSKTLAGADEQTIWVWSVETGKLLWRKDKQNNVSALAWSPDGDRLATTEWGDKGAIHIWQGQSGKLLQEVSLPVYRLAWSPDGKRLAINIPAPDTGSHRLVLMDAASGKLLAKSQELNVCEAFHWSSDGKSFVTVSAKTDGYHYICVWDGANCTQLRSMRLWRIPGFYHAAWSPDGRILAMSNDSQIFLHNSDGHPLGVLLPFDVFGQLAVTADGQYRGNARVERLIRMVVQKSDGTTETLTPLEFEQKHGFKNDPSKVRLLDK